MQTSKASRWWGIAPQLMGRTVRRPPSVKRWPASVMSALLVGAIILASPSSVLAQDTQCTYETCALRLKRKFLTSGQVVRGVEEEHVASIWFLAPKISPLLERTDSAGHYYESFRKLHNRGTWVGLTGVVMMVTGIIIAGGDDDALAIGVAFSGLIPFTWGLIDNQRARDRLGRAIWWYNGTLR